MLVTQSCPTLWGPLDCSPPDSSVHGILQNTGVGCHFLLQGIFPTQGSNRVSHTAGRFFTIWAIRGAPSQDQNKNYYQCILHLSGTKSSKYSVYFTLRVRGNLNWLHFWVGRVATWAGGYHTGRRCLCSEGKGGTVSYCWGSGAPRTRGRHRPWECTGAESGTHSRDRRMDITRGLLGGDQTLSVVIPGGQVGFPEAWNRSSWGISEIH